MHKLIVAVIAAGCFVVPALAVANGDTDCEDTATLTSRTSDVLCSAPPADKPDKPDESGKPDKPNLDAGFYNRIWKIQGLANGFEDGVLDFTASRFMKVPKKYRDDDDAVVGEDSRVLVSSKTRVYDEDRHRLTGDEKSAALDKADTVIVIGKVRPVAKWQLDEDGIAVPTIRAKRISITG